MQRAALDATGVNTTSQPLLPSSTASTAPRVLPNKTSAEPRLTHAQRAWQLASVKHVQGQLINKSVLFLGPADTNCSVELCDYDVVIITNNMVRVVPPRSCYALMLVTNHFFGHVMCGTVDADHIRTTQKIEALPEANVTGLAAVLTTSALTVNRLTACLPNTSRVVMMRSPAVRGGGAVTLSYVMKYLRTIHFARLHITGITFYDNGQQYVRSYGLLHESGRHNLDANKEYVFKEMISHNCRGGSGPPPPACVLPPNRTSIPINLLQPVQGHRVSIDYPACVVNGTSIRPWTVEVK